MSERERERERETPLFSEQVHLLREATGMCLTTHSHTLVSQSCLSVCLLLASDRNRGRGREANDTQRTQRTGGLKKGVEASQVSLSRQLRMAAAG